MRLSDWLLVGSVVGKRESRAWIVPDELWSLIELLPPKPGPKLVEGRPRIPDRETLCGILHTGIHWEYLPQELGFGWGMTCRRRPGHPARHSAGSSGRRGYAGQEG